MKKVTVLILACLFIFTFSTTQSSAAILREFCVDPSGATGTGYDAYFMNLQNALDAAETNIAPTYIYVSQGTYTGNFTYSSSQGYALSIFGGYALGTACSSGNRVLNPTNTIIDGNNSGIALFLSNTDNGNITVEGFTIQDGDNTFGGGGLRAISSTASGTGDDITVTSNIFSNNSAARGGGVYAASTGTTGAGNITITDNTFSGNTIDEDNGGGVYAESTTTSGYTDTITLQDNTFTSNTASHYGGGAYIHSNSTAGEAGNITIQGNTFTLNTTGFNGGAVFAKSEGSTGSGNISVADNTCNENSSGNGGAGMEIWTVTDSRTSGMITIEDNTFSENTAGTVAGGIAAASDSTSGNSGDIIAQRNTCTDNVSSGASGGGLKVESTGETGSGSLTIHDNFCSGNGGGGIASWSQTNSGASGTISLMDNIVSGNTSFQRAGIYARSQSASGTAGPVIVVNNMVSGNYARNQSAGIEASSFNAGAAVTSAVTFTNNTVTQNTASSSAGAYLLSHTNDVYAYNNIVWGNIGSDFSINAGGNAYGYNNDYSSMSGSWNGGSGNNINADPKFIKTGYWDGAVWVDGDYHLKGASPCINAGDNSAPSIPSLDFEGDDRIRNDIVDMGADEAAASAFSHMLLLLLN